MSKTSSGLDRETAEARRALAERLRTLFEQPIAPDIVYIDKEVGREPQEISVSSSTQGGFCRTDIVPSYANSGGESHGH